MGDERFDRLRATLAEYDAPRGLVIFPGDEGIPDEGALTLIAEPDGSWSLVSVDYGQPRRLRHAADAAAIEQETLDYLLRPQLEPLPMPADDREKVLARQAPHIMDLAARTEAGSLLIDIPSGILLDRLGALDGFLLYPAGTSFEARSLPPNVLEQPLRTFVTAGDLRVRAERTPPWFGRPGGGVRFRIEDEQVSIRDLVISDVLMRLTPEPVTA